MGRRPPLSGRGSAGMWWVGLGIALFFLVTPVLRRPLPGLLEAVAQGDSDVGRVLGVAFCLPMTMGTLLMIWRPTFGFYSLLGGTVLVVLALPMLGRYTTDEVAESALVLGVPGFFTGMFVGALLWVVALALLLVVLEVRARTAGPSTGRNR